MVSAEKTLMKKPSAIVAAVNSSMLEKAFIERERNMGRAAVFCKRANRTRLMFSVELKARQQPGIFWSADRFSSDGKAILKALTLTTPDAGAGLMNKVGYDALARGLKNVFAHQVRYRGAPGTFGKEVSLQRRKTGENSR